MTLLSAVASKGPLWGLGLSVGILEILLGFWASQQYYAARAALILIWVGFMALFRGIGEIVLAFTCARKRRSDMATGDDDAAAEVERLRSENERAPSRGRARSAGCSGTRIRAVAAVVAVFFAVASFAVGLPGAWARRTLTNTDTYLSVVGPLASDPAVQEALAREITTAVFTAVDVAGAAHRGPDREGADSSCSLPARSRSRCRRSCRTRCRRSSRATSSARSGSGEPNRAAEARRGAPRRHEVLQVQNGEVVLNYLPLVNQALAGRVGHIERLAQPADHPARRSPPTWCPPTRSRS